MLAEEIQVERQSGVQDSKATAVRSRGLPLSVNRSVAAFWSCNGYSEFGLDIETKVACQYVGSAKLIHKATK